eukprot:symbB.v1.2.039372.t1/scaffold6512.1/size17487/1
MPCFGQLRSLSFFLLVYWALVGGPLASTLGWCPLGRFSVIPPISNPKSRQNLEASKELDNFLSDNGVADFEKIECRWHFWLPWNATQNLKVFRFLSSVRFVALDAYPPGNAWTAADAKELASWICAQVCWEKVDFTRKSLGNLSPRTCHVCLRRRKGGEAFGDDVSLALRRELALCLQEQHGWVAQVKRSKADLELHVLLGLDGRILLEVPLLVQRIGLSGGLPQPGMKQVEAWAVAKSLKLEKGDVVLDPMCGKGTLLAEAAIWWPEAHYIGCDTSTEQLEACRENHRHLRVELEMHVADVAKDHGLPLPDSSVDKLMTVPPWDKQFEAHGGLDSLYRAMLKEFERVLRPNGTMAVLLNLQAEQALCPLLVNWTTSQCRFSMTRHTVGVLLVAQPGNRN